MKYFPVLPSFIPFLIKDVVFHIPNNKRRIFLTFDDGPHPESTPLLLQLLQQWNIKAVFFCLGKNIEQFPELTNQIIKDGHIIGNHGYDHLNGWSTDTNTYFLNFERGKKISGSNLFRPPYGKIGLSQFMKIKKHTQIVLWSIMPGDFQAEMDTQACANTILRHTKEGSIIVLHDNHGFINKTLEILRKCLPVLKERGFEFGLIRDPDSISDRV